MLLSTETIKFTSITQNNHVYEHTAEGPTLKVSLNVRSPYRRQKRDLSIIRSSFRRSHTRIEIPAINILSFFQSYRLFPISYFLATITFYFFATIISYFFATILIISYLFIFLVSLFHFSLFYTCLFFSQNIKDQNHNSKKNNTHLNN